MLPFSHYIIHLSDTHLQKLEDVKVRPVKEKMDRKMRDKCLAFTTSFGMRTKQPGFFMNSRGAE